jgi:2-aminoadipate transaminase
MNWESRFARRTRLMRRSTVREILKHMARPGMISFAGGLPAPELFPMDQVKAASEAVLNANGARALQYGESEGIPELRDYIAKRFSKNGREVKRENVVITSGGQQALDLIGRVLLDSGDKVLVENPTYLALLSAWRPYGPEFIPLETSVEGGQATFDFEDLTQKLSLNPKVLYLVPNFQNPQGTTLSVAGRKQLLSAVSKTETLIVEDDPYGELRYDGEFAPSIFELAGPNAHNVVNVGTFSKVLAPGFRVGWAVGPAELIDKLVLSRQAMDLHTSTFTQLVIWELIRTGVLDAQLPILRERYRERRELMLAEMEKQFPSTVRWTRPEGGMFLMVELPEGVSARELGAKALEKNVLFVPGDDFHLEGGHNTFRLNFSNASKEMIREGIRRLGELLRENLPAPTSKNPPEKVPAGVA